MTEMTQVLASRWKRLGGALVDGLIGMVVTIPVMVSMGLFEQMMQGQGMSIGQQAFFFVFGLAVFLIVHGYLLAKRGQTVGKFVLGTRIVNNNTGQLVPFNKLFGLRYLPLMIIALIPILGNLLCIIDALFVFRDDKRCVHDLIAGTRVVDVKSPEPVVEIETP